MFLLIVVGAQLDGRLGIVHRSQTLQALVSQGTLLCGFLSSMADSAVLATVASQHRDVRVAATLSLAAARHYNVTVPAYVLFNDSVALFHGDKTSVSGVSKFLTDSSNGCITTCLACRRMRRSRRLTGPTVVAR